MAVNLEDSYAFDIDEVEYLRHGDRPYIARIFRPRGAGPFPALVEAHGGAWSAGGRANNDAINGALAEKGIVVAALEFRLPPDATYPGSVADVNYGVRWLKSQAAQFNTRPEMVGLTGTSSGGHLAVLVALKPDDARYAAIPLAGHPTLTAEVPYVVALWPVICPYSRCQDVKARLAANPDNQQLRGNAELSLKYWLTEDAMAEGSPNLALKRGDPIQKPNILYLQNPNDTLHPRANLESFVDGYHAAGGNLQLEFFEGETYDTIRSHPDSDSARAAIRKMAAFVHREASASQASAA